MTRPDEDEEEVQIVTWADSEEPVAIVDAPINSLSEAANYDEQRSNFSAEAAVTNRSSETSRPYGDCDETASTNPPVEADQARADDARSTETSDANARGMIEDGFGTTTDSPMASQVLFSQIEPHLHAIESDLRIMRMAAKKNAETIDELIRENQVLRAGEYEAMLKPFRLGLIRHYDVMRDLLDQASPPHDVFEPIYQNLLDLLDELDLRPVPLASGERFDRDTQRVRGTVPTTDPSASQTVALVVKEAFSNIDGSMFRAAEVYVYRLEDAGDALADTQSPVSATPGTTNEEESPK